MIISKEEKTNLVDNLSWMIEEMKHRSDDEKGNLEVGSQGDYSDELKSAMTLLEDIQKTDTIESTGCHRKSVAVNCRDFDCNFNVSGLCKLSKITLEKVGIVGKLNCVQAEEKETKANGVVQETQTK